jgi:hypothetical protein
MLALNWGLVIADGGRWVVEEPCDAFVVVLAKELELVQAPWWLLYPWLMMIMNHGEDGEGGPAIVCASVQQVRAAGGCTTHAARWLRHGSRRRLGDFLSIEPINEGEEEEEAARVVGHNASGAAAAAANKCYDKSKGKEKLGSKKQMAIDAGQANVQGGRDMRTKRSPSAFLTWTIPSPFFVVPGR